MPADSHPMTMFNTAILVMERDSIFRRRYTEGMHKDEYWEAALEDSLDMIAKLPAIAAGIYRMHTRKGAPIPSDPKLDWGGDFAHMLGIPDTYGRIRQPHSSLFDACTAITRAGTSAHSPATR